MKRKLFCEICPFTYKLSVLKCRMVKRIKNLTSSVSFAKRKSEDKLPVVVFEHSSLIRRELKGVDMRLQENKATNLSIAAPKVNGIVIEPGEVFSFWKLVGSTTKRKGYKEGLNISNSETTAAIGGGMCQFTNLIHWMILNTPIEIVEHHHHDGFDLFPDFGRKIPFGTGTSIVYNYLDYRFKNNTDKPFQLITYVTDTHLVGELRSCADISTKYEITAEDEHFVREGGAVYRVGKVVRKEIDKATNQVLSQSVIRENYAKVLYDTKELNVVEA